MKIFITMTKVTLILFTKLTLGAAGSGWVGKSPASDIHLSKTSATTSFYLSYANNEHLNEYLLKYVSLKHCHRLLHSNCTD